MTMHYVNGSATLGNTARTRWPARHIIGGEWLLERRELDLLPLAGTAHRHGWSRW
ncbi:hypothetical protein Dvina_17310 [Dactylosporangium vinaceum]|uniref:Uncharacterized protein n=1 Tax=Dactylosporangium vinaceum TaxID=53362 RepID=A0ABV5M3I2_9ACTN|nr:hypothetical protein [Dactylosporangium vinaceum]UAB99668.1 hypothetical protein Dvina_17310 [Dactylosporangium vinaceum]